MAKGSFPMMKGCGQWQSNYSYLRANILNFQQNNAATQQEQEEIDPQPVHEKNQAG
jgi:hypothetical protein